MKIKTILVSIAIVVLSIQAQAQFQLGVRAGMNVNEMKIFNNPPYGYYGIYKKERNIGFHVGLVSDYLFNDSWSLRSGLYYTRKGYDLGFRNNDQASIKINRINMEYLELPLLVAYTWRNFSASIGPYVAYGIRGEHIFDVKEVGNQYKGSHSLNPTNDYFLNKDNWETYEEWQPLDYGWVFDLSYQRKRWRTNLTYNLGIADTSVRSESIIPATQSNRTMMLSVSYFFIKKK